MLINEQSSHSIKLLVLKCIWGFQCVREKFWLIERHTFISRRLMIIIASFHRYANETSDSMEDSIEALHELMHFFYSSLCRSTASSGMYRK